jgi:uncharacterized protein YcbX
VLGCFWAPTRDKSLIFEFSRNNIIANLLVGSMASNMLDDILNSVGISITPLTLVTTIFVILFPILAAFFLALSQRETPLPPPAGCRKLGLKGRSNLEDQHSKKYARGGSRTPANPWTVKALFVYPVKSCAPVELEKSDVIRTGLKYDRQFTLGQLVTGLPSMEGKVTSEWHFMSQRKFPRLAKVETEIWAPDPSAPAYKQDGEWVQSEGCVVVRFPFSPDTDFSLEGLKNCGKILAAKLSGTSEPMLEFRVPFNPPKSRMTHKNYKTSTLHIWQDAPSALDVSSEIDPEVLAKFQYTLGTSNPISLFRIDTNAYRKVAKNAPGDTLIGMQDSHPVHILNLASVHDVAEKLPRQPTPFNMITPLLNALRFRANVYITGPPAFHEDDWAKANIGASTYHISCRTTRCKLPNTDPETGVADRNEPMTTLRKYRVVDEGSKSACLGMQVTPLGDGEMRVGDRVELLETGAHRFEGASGRKVEG